MRHREQYVLELAETVKRLFSEGKIDPSADEIAKSHFPDKALGGEIIEGIRKRLRRVRDVLEDDYELPVYLLNHRYYSRYRTEAPTTEAEARRCVPGGYGVPADGVRLNQGGEDDLIYLASIRQNIDSGAGKLKKQVDRTVEGVEDHRIAKPRAATLLDHARKRAEPDKPRLAERIAKALPKRAGSE